MPRVEILGGGSPELRPPVCEILGGPELFEPG